MSRPIRSLTGPLPEAVRRASRRTAGRWRVVSLPALAAASPDGRRVLERLDALVDECLRTGTSRVHLEASETGLRVRLREGDRLESRRGEDVGDADAALEAALEALEAAAAGSAGGGGAAGDPARLVLRSGSGRAAFASIARADGAYGVGAVLALRDHPPVAPTLDALVDDARSLGELRTALDGREGLVLLAGTDPVALEVLAEAVAQERVGPDAKVVHVCAAARYPLAGVLQLERSDARPEDVLGQDADTVVLDPRAAGAASPAALRTLCAEALVVCALRARGVGPALEALHAEGVGDAWLAGRLRAVVCAERVRLLCDSCRRPVADDAHRPAEAADDESPTRRLLATSLHRLCEAPGCADCGGTGVARTRTLIDVLGATAPIRELLARGERDAASAALASQRRAVATVRTWSMRGLVDAAEVRRLDAVRTAPIGHDAAHYPIGGFDPSD